MRLSALRFPPNFSAKSGRASRDRSHQNAICRQDEPAPAIFKQMYSVNLHETLYFGRKKAMAL